MDKTHSGVYTCTVTGSSKLMHVSLLVSHEPHVSAAHYSVSQAIGLSIQLDCEVNILKQSEIVQESRRLLPGSDYLGNAVTQLITV